MTDSVLRVTIFHALMIVACQTVKDKGVRMISRDDVSDIYELFDDLSSTISRGHNYTLEGGTMEQVKEELWEALDICEALWQRFARVIPDPDLEYEN